MSARTLQWTSASASASSRHRQRQRRCRQETEATQQREHKQRLQSGSTNISAAYDDDNDDNEAHNDNNEPHNQSGNNNNNDDDAYKSLFVTTNYSIFGLREWQQLQQLPQTIPFPLPALFPLPILLLLVLLVDCSAAQAVNDSSSLAQLSTEIALSFNETATAPATTAVAPPTTALTVTGRDNSEPLDEEDADNTSEYIFDRTDVRIIFITLYTIVFCCCFFGEYPEKWSQIYNNVIYYKVD